MYRNLDILIKSPYKDDFDFFLKLTWTLTTTSIRYVKCDNNWRVY